MSLLQPVTLFVSMTGKRHLHATREWGPGMACSDSFALGETTEGAAEDVDCKRCEKVLGDVVG